MKVTTLRHLTAGCRFSFEGERDVYVVRQPARQIDERGEYDRDFVSVSSVALKGWRFWPVQTVKADLTVTVLSK